MNEEHYSIHIYGTCEVGKYELGKTYKKTLGGKEYLFTPVTDNKKRPLSVYYYSKIKKYRKELEKFDVVYAQRMEYSLTFRHHKKIKERLIMAVHGSGAYTTMWRGRFVAFFYNIAERMAVKASRKVIVLQKREEFGVPYYKKRYKKQSDRIVFGRVPINQKVFYTDLETKKQKDDLFNILFLGRVDHNPKRVLCFPYIAKKLIDNGYKFKFTVIGDGPSMNELKESIKNLGVENVFDIKGKISHGKELTRLVNLADVSLIISMFEGICMSALESIARGVPVIATDVGDVKEYINNGENGIVIPNDDNTVVNDCAETIEKMMKNRVPTNDKYLEYTPEYMLKELEGIFES